MKPIFGVILSFGQLLAIVALYYITSTALAIVSPHYLPGYSIASADNDTRTIFIIFLLYDRFYGPYSTLLKGVAKALKQAKRRAE